MTETLEGELTRHHNQPFYAQKQQPKFFWSGCLVPLAVIGVLALLALKGLSGASITDIALGFMRIALLLSFALMIFGAIIFGKTRSSLGKGLLLGAFVVLLLLAFGLISLFTTSGNALK